MTLAERLLFRLSVQPQVSLNALRLGRGPGKYKWKCWHQNRLTRVWQ
jgi:hypothetical protein